MKKLMMMIAGVIFLLPGCSSAQKLSAEQQFKKSFPQVQYETFTQASIHGIYEVYDGQRILYYFPEGDVILAGNIFSKDGKNITQESITKRMAAKLADLPLAQALKIGNGKTAVVEFIDPNCHYCRMSFNFFNERKKDITMYVFFHPLSEDSSKKIRHIVCARDKVQTYEDVLNGKLDGNAQLNLCNTKEAETMLQNHQQISAKVGVRATPLFYIKGEVVPGFDQPPIEILLAK